MLKLGPSKLAPVTEPEAPKLEPEIAPAVIAAFTVSWSFNVVVPVTERDASVASPEVESVVAESAPRVLAPVTPRVPAIVPFPEKEKPAPDVTGYGEGLADRGESGDD
jgi:hypothetical protein